MDEPRIHTVGEITRSIKALIEDGFADVWIEGEISNYHLHRSSGHRYFNLTDGKAQLRCCFWRQVAARKLCIEPAEGMLVQAHGRLTVYEARGEYQLVVDALVARGTGALEIAFRKLKERLAAEGLFDPERKRDLPRFPASVGVVTSSTGAAIHDIVTTIKRHHPSMRIVVAPVAVQGAGAAEQIAAAVVALNRLEGADAVDALIVGRGGGSLEDLWAFNEEVVARAVFASDVPAISAVGHEIDFTITDMVADVRAATPTAAAELVTADWVDARARIGRLIAGMISGQRSRIDLWRERLARLSGSPAIARPLDRIEQASQSLDLLQDRLGRAGRDRASRYRAALERETARLQALSPGAVLERGYSVTRLIDSGRVLKSSEDVSRSVQIETTLARGSVVSTVDETREPEESRRTAIG